MKNLAAFVILALNLIAFIILAIVGLVAHNPASTIDTIIDLTAFSGMQAIISKPWTLITYSFVHLEPVHLLVNMLWLAWFGLMLRQHCTAFSVYLCWALSAICGALGYAFYSLIPGAETASLLVGASAATLGIVAMGVVIIPSRKVSLALIGQVHMRTLAAIGMVVFFVGILKANMASNVPHICGMLSGGIVGITTKRIMAKRQHKAFTKPTVHSSVPHLTTYDDALYKAQTSGYSSLSATERALLTDSSRHSSSENISTK